MIKKDFSINNCNISSEKTIALFADTHFSSIVRINKLKEIKQSIIDNKPSYICVPGDVVDMSNYLDFKDNRNFVLKYFDDLQRVAPIFISLGSHDYSRIENNKWIYDFNKIFFEELNNLGNTYVLNNSFIDTEDVRFLGYSFNYDYYYNKSKEESSEILINDYNLNMPIIDEGKYNILLAHSPIKILNDEVINNIDELKKIKLILSGHMHNGMLPDIIDRTIKNNYGLIAPNKSLFPNNVRGLVTKKVNGKEINMIITGGVTKIQESAPKILQFGNKFYDSEIDYIKLKK